MAPTKKSKKTADSINSRLALVMKSGKGICIHSLAILVSTTGRGLIFPCLSILACVFLGA